MNFTGEPALDAAAIRSMGAGQGRQPSVALDMADLSSAWRQHGRSQARQHGPLRAPDSVQSELRNVPWIGLELTSFDALDDVSQHIVGARRSERSWQKPAT